MAVYKSRKIYVYLNPEIKERGRWKQKLMRIPKAQLMIAFEKGSNAKTESHLRVSVKDRKQK